MYRLLFTLCLDYSGMKCAGDVSALFAEELLPVAPKAQKKVPIPEGLVYFFFVLHTLNRFMIL